MRIAAAVRGALKWRPRRREKTYDGSAEPESTTRAQLRTYLRTAPTLREHRRARFGKVDRLRGAWWTRATDRAGYL